ncbi:type II toxin-antitoxin system RelE/ParE family toxin [Terracidiphilus sp.]|jgi:plasmid stabilization system protein ParE|uniref:type II toxin-antitoxin system RelE/ParE family toxin n=1 Tax=Terracidiphilus sp. TaxID=1964191 RepID=UPI003C279822
MSLKPIRLRSEAGLEIEDAFEYYRRESPRTAARFLTAIGASLKKIRRNPQLYPPYTKNTRRRVLGSFPFSVIYQEKEDIILIVAIAHAKRREGYWLKRLKQ